MKDEAFLQPVVFGASLLFVASGRSKGSAGGKSWHGAGRLAVTDSIG